MSHSTVAPRSTARAGNALDCFREGLATIRERFSDPPARTDAAPNNTVSKPSARLRLYSPSEAAPADDGEPPRWLSEACRLRSDVLFDKGARPAFGPGGTHYGDPDHRDTHAFHIVARLEDKIVGYLRLLPLKSGGTEGVLDELLGGGVLDRALTALRLIRDHCLEGSRLTVHPDHQGTNLARRLVAAGWAAGGLLGATFLVAGLGMRDRQDRFFALCGARPLPGIEPAPSPLFADAVRPMFGRIESPSRMISDYVVDLRADLSLGPV